MNQIAFSFDSNDRYDPNEFIESPSNVIAARRLTTWPTNTWGIAPYPKALILRGPASCGKTYLAKKWARISGAIFLRKNRQLTEKMLGEHQAFIIDEFDRSWHEEKTLHYFNAIAESNKYLLITLNEIPKLLLPDLASRIKATYVLDIGLPDDRLVAVLIFKLFSNLSVVIDKEVINYLINILPREFPEIIIAVEKINAYAIKHKRKITVPLAKSALGI